MDAVTTTPSPVNEPVGSFAPGSAERERLQAKLAELAANPTEIHHVIDGEHRRGTGRLVDVVQPHRHSAVLGSLTTAQPPDVHDAITARKPSCRRPITSTPTSSETPSHQRIL
jgi:1-pyrroline-5-carboxylate dehydrogenase